MRDGLITGQHQRTAKALRGHNNLCCGSRRGRRSRVRVVQYRSHTNSLASLRSTLYPLFQCPGGVSGKMRMSATPR
jgi:hypothetical protein